MKITKKAGKVYSVKTKSPKAANPKTVNVAINNCYGGFSLSPKAVHLLACRQGKPCYFFTTDYIIHSGTKYVPVEGYPEGMFWAAFTVKDPENHEYNDITIDRYPRDRANPVLIAVIKELGKSASGACSKIKIVKVPADVKWVIEEYDGMEWVAEIHRTWC